MAPNDLQPGPYNNTHTTTFEISNVKITITTKDDSSHVPKGCSCGGASSIEQMIAALFSRMNGGGAGGAPSDAPADEPTT